MKDNLLFVNRDEAEIKEFLNAMQDYTFEIDTTDSGLEAAALLRKKQYKVVVTGMNLSNYDGSKLIAYLNSRCPYTACIVYTTRVDLAQLRLLVNKRKVFRIFLKPVNYRGDFYSAIQDGFTYYDMREAQVEESKNKEKKKKMMEAAGVGTQGTVASGELAWKEIKQLVYPLLDWSVQTFDIQLSEQEQKTLVAYEEGILEYYLKEHYRACGSIEEVTNTISKEFKGESQNQRIVIEMKQKPVNPKPGFFERLHFLLWLLIRQITDISDSYDIKIKLDFEVPFRPLVQVQARVSKEEWKRYRKQNIARASMLVVYNVVAVMSAKCRRELSEDRISYQIEMRTEGHKKRTN